MYFLQTVTSPKHLYFEYKQRKRPKTKKTKNNHHQHLLPNYELNTDPVLISMYSNDTVWFGAIYWSWVALPFNWYFTCNNHIKNYLEIEFLIAHNFVFEAHYCSLGTIDVLKSQYHEPQSCCSYDYVYFRAKNGNKKKKSSSETLIQVIGLKIWIRNQFGHFYRCFVLYQSINNGFIPLEKWKIYDIFEIDHTSEYDSKRVEYMQLIA